MEWRDLKEFAEAAEENAPSSSGVAKLMTSGRTFNDNVVDFGALTRGSDGWQMANGRKSQAA